MKPWSEAELNYMRVSATPLLVVTASEESLHEPARQMVPQPPLPCLWPPRRGPRCDPLSEGAPLPMQTLQTDLHRDKRYCSLPVPQAEVADDRGSDVAGLRLPGAGCCRRLRSRRAHRRPLAKRSCRTFKPPGRRQPRPRSAPPRLRGRGDRGARGFRQGRNTVRRESASRGTPCPRPRRAFLVRP
ncbi:hypothetical protein BH18ACT11_BH18ACT11_30600 [soil metagenome]